MAKLTKLALEQINAALAAENASLRKQVGDLLMDLSYERAAHKAQLVAPAPARRAQYAMPAWQVQRAEAMAAAKALAVAGGHVVKV